ncbi:hypothetical protein [Allostreptomyces psammosilenae]|uniref:Uncharacterized protein n=1 Tax=Allostreptomyces psammosilenae TaxID=1892865 RepID=A0A852ZL62_9ACTN|nr:hypothetical protein [Allostreptomyces psammosilenae]NYI03116.1 hypothetical protein [Allostreptomyces psammosilenae]
MRALRYEVRRLAGLRSVWGWTLGGVLASALLAYAVARSLRGPVRPEQAVEMLTAAAPLLPLPPAGVCAGVVAAMSFGHEYRYGTLTPALLAMPRRVALPVAKVLVAAGHGVLMALLALVAGEAVAVWRLGHGLLLPALLGGAGGAAGVGPVLGGPGEALRVIGGCVALVVLCAVTALLVAGVARSATLGLCAVLLLPVVVEPLLSALFEGAWGERLAGARGYLPFFASRDLLWDGAAGGRGWWDAVPAAAVAGLATTGLLLLVCLVVLRRRRVP